MRDWRAHDAAIPFRVPRPPAQPLRNVVPAESEVPDKPRYGRRLSWEALWRERPDLRPVNDNA